MADELTDHPAASRAAAAGCFPADWQALLFRALDLVPGDELQPRFLEALYYFNRNWVNPARAPAAAAVPAAPPGIDYASPQADLRAYACFYMTINMPKLWFVLDRTPALAGATEANQAGGGVTELGCGPGTFLWAYLFWLRAHAPEQLAQLRRVTGVDRSAPALALARRLGAELAHHPEFAHLTFAFHEGDWREQRQSPADLLIFGNVLNEGVADSAEWTAAVAARAIVIIEPGTVPVFHRLLPVRDALVRAGWQVQFPCVRADMPCPMKPDNWCHFCVNRFQLPLIQRMANRAGRLNERHNFSAFVFTRAPAGAPVAPEGAPWRVLSTLRKSNRSGIRWLCDGARLKEVVLSRRDRTPANRPFLDAAWGDRLLVHPGIGRNDPGRSGHIAEDDTIPNLRSPHPRPVSGTPAHPPAPSAAVSGRIQATFS